MTQYTKEQFDEMMLNKVAPQLGDTVLHSDNSIEEVVHVMEGSHICATQWKVKSEALLVKEKALAEQQAINEANRKRQEDIANLKRQLSDTDYKIIKCYEYSLAGKEQPYNIIELNTERDAIRDQINGLESL